MSVARPPAEAQLPSGGPAPKPPSSTAIADFWRQVHEKPWDHDFFHALRRLENLHADRPRLGTARRPQDEALRLGQSPELSFAPAALHAASGPTAHSAGRIDVRFFGLFGPNGPLPLHLTEYARERLLHAGDAGFTRFADLFHHRLLLLFYRAWAQAQPTVSLDRQDDDRISDFVGSLVGIGSPALRDRDSADDHARLHFAGILSSPVRSAEGLARMLSGVLSRPVQVEQFVGTWMPLPESERTRIGRNALGERQHSGNCVGGGAVLGGAVWDRQHGFRIHVGPLDARAFAALLPDGDNLPRIIPLIQHYVGEELHWDLRLVLDRDQVPPARPGIAGRLGWTSWLGQRERAEDAHIVLTPGPAIQRLLKTRRPRGAGHPN